MDKLEELAWIMDILRPLHEHEYVNVSPPWHKEAFLLRCKICGHEIVDMTPEAWRDLVSNSYIDTRRETE